MLADQREQHIMSYLENRSFTFFRRCLSYLYSTHFKSHGITRTETVNTKIEKSTLVRKMHLPEVNSIVHPSSLVRRT
jgi:hypothetical protein